MVQLKGGAFYTMHHDPGKVDVAKGIGIRTFTLKEGESFSLNGIIGELDSTHKSCGEPPFFIPAFILDNEGCVGVFNETFTYNDFVDGGATGTAQSALNSESCNFTFEYSLTVLKGGTSPPSPVANFAL